MVALSPTIDQVVARKIAWRSQTMRDYAIALVMAAIARADNRIMPAVNNDDVPDQYQPNDKTSVGAVFRLLLSAGVLVHWRGTVEAMGIYGGFRSSTRAANNGHRNQLYTLTSVPIAREWLARQGAPLPKPPRRQMELFN